MGQESLTKKSSTFYKNKNYSKSALNRTIDKDKEKWEKPFEEEKHEKLWLEEKKRD